MHLTPKNFGDRVTLAMPSVDVKDHVQTYSGNTRVKFEVRSFNRFGAYWHLTPQLSD